MFGPSMASVAETGTFEATRTHAATAMSCPGVPGPSCHWSTAVRLGARDDVTGIKNPAVPLRMPPSWARILCVRVAVVAAPL